MPGFIPDEGENFIATFLIRNLSADRGTLQLGLFTNPTVDETTTLASITEPTGGAYARKTLTDTNWVVTGNTATYNSGRVFGPTGTNYTGTIYGYFIATSGTVPKLLALEVEPRGPFTLAVGDFYTITPSVTIS